MTTRRQSVVQTGEAASLGREPNPGRLPVPAPRPRDEHLRGRRIEKGLQLGGGVREFSRIPLRYPPRRTKREPLGFPLVAEFVRILPGRLEVGIQPGAAHLSQREGASDSVEASGNSHEFRYVIPHEERSVNP